MRRLDEWSKHLISVARVVCDHVEDGQDSRGHAKRPCMKCMRTVRHVTEFWFMALHTKARAAEQKAEKEGLDLPMVDLFEALFIASSLLDPATSVAIPDWGPA